MGTNSFPDRLAGEFENSLCSRIDQIPNLGRFGEMKHSLHPELIARLSELGLSRLYCHQSEAADAALDGKDVVLVTGTNSGKTLGYNIPVLQRLMSEPNSRSLYLFPTKALAQDQLGKLEALTDGLGIGCGTYDGDTPNSQRGLMRRNAQIVLTNPDMLHVGILPQYESWLKFIRSLSFIVLDEIHAYRGVFGSHVGGILRRLLRLCKWQGSHPQIIACSATIANPVQHFESLVGREPFVIADDGSRRAERHFIFLTSTDDGVEPLSSNELTSRILSQCVAMNARTMAFCRSRVGAELVLLQTRRMLEALGHDPRKVESYRGGYSAEDRRQIERKLFDGELIGLATTNAMELGVDVGQLDAVILNGYPGSLSSFFQQAGRAGRGNRPGTALMVARLDPLEQFIVRSPEMLFDRPIERVAVNPQNAYVLKSQLLCAAYERALDSQELEQFGHSALGLCEAMIEAGELRFQAGRFFYPSHESPAPKIDIRGLNGPTITLRSNGVPLGMSEYWRAVRSLHAGAVYLHRGRSFVVEQLDLQSCAADLIEQHVDYYTRTVLQSIVEPGQIIRSRKSKERTAELLGLHSTTLVLGYQRISIAGNDRSAPIELQMPPQDYDTVGIRISPSLRIDPECPESAGAILHSMEHALLAVAPLIAGCDRADLGSAWPMQDPGTGKPAVYIFDAILGGMGLSEKLFESWDEWLAAALALLEDCPCETGCPACSLSATCEIANEFLDKQGAISELKRLAILPTVV